MGWGQEGVTHCLSLAAAPGSSAPVEAASSLGGKMGQCEKLVGPPSQRHIPVSPPDPLPCHSTWVPVDGIVRRAGELVLV